MGFWTWLQGKGWNPVETKPHTLSRLDAMAQGIPANRVKTPQPRAMSVNRTVGSPVTYRDKDEGYNPILDPLNPLSPLSPFNPINQIVDNPGVTRDSHKNEHTPVIHKDHSHSNHNTYDPPSRDYHSHSSPSSDHGHSTSSYSSHSSSYDHGSSSSYDSGSSYSSSDSGSSSSGGFD